MVLSASTAAVVSACVIVHHQGGLSQLRLWFTIPSTQQLLRLFPTLGSQTPIPLYVLRFYLLAC